MMQRQLSRKPAASFVRGAPALLFAMVALAAPAIAEGEETSMVSLRVADPAALTYDSTALGRATHPLRLVFTNHGTRPIALPPHDVRFSPAQKGATFSCDAPSGPEDRWPATLGPGATFVLLRDVTCDTPLPGRYDVEVRARPRDATASVDRFGSFSLRITPGANPPVRIPWNPSLYGAAAGTSDMRPSRDPGAARVVVALINASPSTVALTSMHATMRIRRRGFTTLACADRVIDLGFRGSLAPGRTQALAVPLRCDLSQEGLYDVRVSVRSAAGAKVHLATHAIRVSIYAPVAPGPQDDLRAPLFLGT